MTLNEKQKNNVFWNAINNKLTAGFQNMGDMKKAMKFAEKEGYKLCSEQQLRSLLTEHDGTPILIFVLATEDDNDIAIFCEGLLLPNKSDEKITYLETIPFSIMSL